MSGLRKAAEELVEELLAIDNEELLADLAKIGETPESLAKKLLERVAEVERLRTTPFRSDLSDDTAERIWQDRLEEDILRGKTEAKRDSLLARKRKCP